MYIYTCLLFCLLNLASSFNIQQQISNQQGICKYPMLSQFYPGQSKMPLDDVEVFIQKNISTQSIIDFSSQNISFSKVKAAFTYTENNSRVVKQTINFNAQVFNDTFHLEMSYLAKISKRGGKTYEVTVVVDEIPVNYTKNYSFEYQQLKIYSVVYEFKPEQMKISIANISSDSDKAQIENASKGELFTKVNKIIQPIEQLLNDNAKAQKISKLFPTTPYTYEFKSNPVYTNVQIISLLYSSLNYSGIQFRGTLNLTDQECPSSYKYLDYSDSYYKQFIAFEFGNNLAQYAVKYISDYQKILIDSKFVDTKAFQFRAIDFEYMMPSLLLKYPQYYLNEVNFVCDLDDVSNLTYDKDLERLKAIADWSCKGFLLTPEAKIPILDFTASILYKMRLWIDGTVQVYSDELNLVSIHFNPVSGFEVNSEELAGMFIEETLPSFKGYMIGTFFRVMDGLTKIQWDDSGKVSGFLIS